MAQADIVHITSRSTRHPDDILLTLVGTWKVARAEARLAWAKQDRATKFSTVEGNYDSPSEALRVASNAQEHLADVEPTTTRGAQVLLEAVADIIVTSKLEPDMIFGEGPVLEILVNVARALSKQDIVLHAEI